MATAASSLLKTALFMEMKTQQPIRQMGSVNFVRCKPGEVKSFVLRASRAEEELLSLGVHLLVFTYLGVRYCGVLGFVRCESNQREVEWLCSSGLKVSGVIKESTVGDYLASLEGVTDWFFEFVFGVLLSGDVWFEGTGLLGSTLLGVGVLFKVGMCWLVQGET
ncbi:hypothetical protein Droror1_Dr00000845 [Drosera rotundifolia]